MGVPGVLGARGPRGGVAREGHPASRAAGVGGDDHQAAHVGAPRGSVGADVGHPVPSGARRTRLDVRRERPVAVRGGPEDLLQGPSRRRDGARRVRVRRDATLQPGSLVGDADVSETPVRSGDG